MSIVVKIDLDTSGNDQAFKRIEQDAKRSGEEIGQSIERSINKSVSETSKVLDGLKTLILGIGKAIAISPPVGKGLFGTISKLGFASVGLLELSKVLERLDSQFAKTAASVLRLAGILAGGFAAALTFVVAKAASLASQLGTKLVSVFQSVSNKSNDAKQQLDVLNGVINNFNAITGDAIGTTQEWSGLIDNLSQSLNISTKELNKSAQEIILVGSQIGLTSSQLKNLLQISSEYAKINKKELFPTTLALVNALNGNATAAQALGIKLTETAVKSFAFKKGLTDTFEKLTDNEKAQIRYQKLLTQYSQVTGLASIAAGSLADQSNALSITIEKVSNAFGEGVSKVENFNLLAAALNSIVNKLDLELVSFTGTLSAIGARFLQGAGFVVEWGLKLFFVAKALNLVKILLNLNVKSIDLLTAKIPLLNTSFSTLFSAMSKGKIQAKDVAANLSSLRQSIISILPFLGAASAGVNKKFSIFQSLVEVVKKLGAGLLVLRPILIAILVPLAKIALIIGAVIGVIKTIINAFEELEKRTQVFTKAYNALSAEIKNSSSILQPVIDLFNRFTDVLIDVARRGFGFIVFAISKAVSSIAAIVEKNPFGVFSQETVDSFRNIRMSLEMFENKLAGNGFLLEAYAENAKRNIASIPEELPKVLDKVDQFSKMFSQTIENGVVDVITDATSRIGAQLNMGGKAWQDFSSAVLGIVGDMLISLGRALIAKGLAIDKLRLALASLSGGFAIAAGVGLIALGGLLKSFSGGLTQAATPSGGRGGLAAGGADSPQELIVDQQNIERTRPSTNVEIVVQGTLVQQSELGKFIADTLTEVGDRDGVGVRTRYA